MGLDDELKKAIEDLKKNPPLHSEDYQKGLQWMRERFGEKRLADFMKATDLSDANSDVCKLLQFLDELKNKGVELCDDCEIKVIESFFKKLDAEQAH